MRSLRAERFWQGRGVGATLGDGRGVGVGFCFCGVGCGRGVGGGAVHACVVNGDGVSAVGQSSSNMQVRVCVASGVHGCHSPQAHASAVHGGVQRCASAGLGSSASGQSASRRQLRVCSPAAEHADHGVHCQVSLVQPEPSAVRVCDGSPKPPTTTAASAKPIAHLRYTDGAIICH